MFFAILVGVLYIRINFVIQRVSTGEKAYVFKRESRQDINNSQEELSFIYIGSSTCPFCESSILDTALTSISEQLETYAFNNGYNFNKIGVTTDLDVVEGIEHVMSFNISFNEISTGNNWRNSLAERYTNGEFQSSPSTPQVLIIHRTYTDSIGVQVLNTLSSETLIERHIGLDHIENMSLERVYRFLEKKKNN